MLPSAIDADAAPIQSRESAAQLLVIEGGPGRARWSSLVELWAFRDVLGAFVVRLVKVKYKQAALGVGWAVFQPLVAALIFALFLGRLTHVPSEGVPYIVFAMSGTVVWNFFSTAVGGAMDSVVTDQALLRKVYFPREIFPLSAVLAALVDVVSSCVTLVVVFLAYGLHPHLTWLLLPLPFLLALLTAATVGLTLSAANVFYRDVRYVLPFVLQLGLFATPVVYSLSVVPGRWRLLYVVLNPVAAAIDALRRVVLHGTLPAAGTTIAGFTCSIVGLFAAYHLFKRLERGFSDRI